MTGKEAAIKWAQDLLQGDFILFDTETTGIADDSEIIQVAVLSSTGETLLLSDVKPRNPIDEQGKAFAVNGIGNARLANAPTFAEILPRLQEALTDRIVVIFNRQFDMGRLDFECERLGIYGPRASMWCCAMLQYADYRGDPGKYGGMKWHSLENACKQMGIPVVDAHDGLGDCRLTLALIRAMAGVAVAEADDAFELVLG